MHHLLLLHVVQSMDHPRTRSLRSLSKLIKTVDAIHRPQGKFVQLLLLADFWLHRLEAIALLVVVGLFKLIGILKLLNFGDLLRAELKMIIGLLRNIPALLGNGMYDAQIGDFLHHGLDISGQLLQIDDGISIVGPDQPLLIELLLDFFPDVLSDVLVVPRARALQFRGIFEIVLYFSARLHQLFSSQIITICNNEVLLLEIDPAVKILLNSASYHTLYRLHRLREAEISL